MKTIIGNWKLNKTPLEAKNDIKTIFDFSSEKKINSSVFIAPPHPYLAYLSDIYPQYSSQILSQNSQEFLKGAYTGHISPKMLHDMKVKGSLVGHSECRYMNTDEGISHTLNSLEEESLLCVLCIGESLEEKKSNQGLKKLTHQIKTNISHIPLKGKLMIAYEPIWAIGTGLTASLEEIQNTLEHISHVLSEKSLNVPLIYGGSVDENNISEICSLPRVDGVLVGGKSLDPQYFIKMIQKIL